MELKAICAKLLKDNERCRKKQNFDLLKELFDTTKVKAKWVYKEDESFYKLQIETMAALGILAANATKRNGAMEATVSTLSNRDT